MTSSEPPDQDPFRKKPAGQEPPGEPSYGPPPDAGGPPYGGQPYGQPPPGQTPTPPGGFEHGHGPGYGPTLAGSGKRLLARLVDLLVYIAFSCAIGFAFVGSDPDDGDFGRQAAAGAVAAIVYFFYEGLMLNNNGQTLGKMATRIRVVRVTDGGPVQGSPAWTRAAVFALPLAVPCVGTLFWIVNVVSHLWDRPWQQCLHDKAAGTTVITA